jgi:hypothetical protein
MVVASKTGRDGRGRVINGKEQIDEFIRHT